jgi:hypothetical protein
MKYSYWTRKKVVLAALATTALSAILAFHADSPAAKIRSYYAIVAALLAGGLIIVLGFAARSAHEETADKRQELDRKIAGYDEALELMQGAKLRFERLQEQARALVEEEKRRIRADGSAPASDAENAKCRLN